MKKKDLFKEICKFLLAGIGTKADKGIYSDLLGQISYLIHPKYDEYIDEVLQRIKGQIYKARTLAAFMVHYYQKNGHDKTIQLIEEVVSEENFDRGTDINLAISNVLLAIQKFKVWDIDITVELMVTAGIYAKRIDDINNKKLAVDKIVHNIEKTRKLDKVIYVIRRLQEDGFDNMDESIYEIVERPEKAEIYVELYSVEAVKEAHFRAHLDWFIYSHLAQEVPSIKTDPKLRFEYILNISRCSDLNLEIKNEFLDEYFEYASSLPNEPKEDLVLALTNMNDGFKHFDKWKNRIEARLKNI